MQNWLCAYCKKVVQSERTPPNSNRSCSESPDKWHAWRDIGRCGDNVYECRKCGIIVNSERQPNNGNHCLIRGNHREDHSWHLLRKAPDKKNDFKQDDFKKKSYEERQDQGHKKEDEEDKYESEYEEEKREKERALRHEREMEEQEEQERIREQEYLEWLNSQPCHFCGKVGNVEKYRDFIAHKNCAVIFLNTPEGHEYLKVVKKQKEEQEEKIKKQQMENLRQYRALEEQVQKQEEELRLEKEKKEKESEKIVAKFDRKDKIKKIFQYICSPLIIIILLKIIFNITVLPSNISIIWQLAGIILVYIFYHFFPSKWVDDHTAGSSIFFSAFLYSISFLLCFLLVKYIILGNIVK